MMIIIIMMSVCLSVCSARTFKSLDLENSFLVRSYIFRIFGSSSNIKVIGQGQRSKKACLCIIFMGLPSIENQACCFLSALDKKQQAWSGWDISPRCPVRTL